MVVQLVEKGALGWSSGSVGHLTRRSGKSITQWPIVELSLTPTPAEPRTLGVELIKSLSATDSRFAVFLPETASAAVVQETKSEDVDAPVITIIENEPPEETTMPQETQVVEAKSAIDQLDPKLLELISHATIDAWQKAQKQEQEAKAINGAPMFQTPDAGANDVKAIALRQRRDENQAIRKYFLEYDHRAYLNWLQESVKASNATDMNIGTPADGGYAVPTGHYQRIIARRDELALDSKLGVMNIPGKGTTTNVPLDAGNANVFIATNEAAAFDLDAPVIGQKQMTLVKYTKKLQLSVELIEDEDSGLMAFLEDYVGRALGLTLNSALMTKVLAGGTTVALTGAVALAAHIPTMVYSIPDEYADGAQWVMRRATEGAYRGLSGNNWQFTPTPPGGTSESSLWGFPINHSQFTPAIAASAKTMVLGNFGFVGKRQVNQVTFLRDPYSAANTGQVNLFYYARFVYEVLQAGALMIGTFGT
jgi:HK97 family phage major capsid protein